MLCLAKKIFPDANALAFFSTESRDFPLVNFQVGFMLQFQGCGLNLVEMLLNSFSLSLITTQNKLERFPWQAFPAKSNVCGLGQEPI